MSRPFTDRAIAYLKAVVDEHDSPAMMLSHADSPVMRPFADGLCICYVVDDGESYQYVQQRHLVQDGISEDELYRTGIRNLTELANNRDVRVQPYHGIHAVLMGGDFEASLLLLDQLWEHGFRQFVSGDYAIAIPARDILAFCDSDSAQGISELQQVIARCSSGGDHLISDKIYVRRDGSFVLRSS